MFQTKIQIPSAGFHVNYNHQIMTLGSCFAESIGRKLHEAYFETEINPFGVLYNPISIINSLNLLIDREKYTEQHLFKYNSQWRSYAHTTFFSDISVENCLEKINSRLSKASEFLTKTDFLFITLGTAWVYQDTASGSVVSNCHKLPASHFLRRRLSTEEIIFEFSNMITKLQSLFPHLELIFSVSPIRHWKDGAHENNISKSILLLAIDNLQQKFNRVHYFPAYELLLDELRDYRFYAADMLHPSDVAINYIWQRFSETYFDADTTQIKNELEKLNADLSHRPMHKETEEYIKFSHHLVKKIQDLKLKYPFLLNKLV